MPQVETRIFNGRRNLIFRGNRYRPVHAPDSGKRLGALVDFQAAPGGEDIHLVCVARHAPNPIFGSVQHSSPLAAVPEPYQTRRNARDVTVEGLQAVPVAVVEWNLPAVRLCTK